MYLPRSREKPSVLSRPVALLQSALLSHPIVPCGRYVLCTLGCGERVRQEQLGDHADQTCPLRKTSCEACGLPVPHHRLDEHVAERCLRVPRRCTNGEGGGCSDIMGIFSVWSVLCCQVLVWRIRIQLLSLPAFRALITLPRRRICAWFSGAARGAIPLAPHPQHYSASRQVRLELI